MHRTDGFGAALGCKESSDKKRKKRKKKRNPIQIRVRKRIQNVRVKKKTA